MRTTTPLTLMDPVPEGPDLEDSLDFINTLEHSRDGDREHLPSADAVETWFGEHRVGETGSTHLDPADLARVHAVRTAMREVVDAVVDRRAADAAALATLNELLGLVDIPRLVAIPTGVEVSLECRADPLADALAHLVEPLVTVLREGQHERLRTCDDETCRWVFYDDSRTGRRRWCSMETCGNRAKAARHRAKVRTSGAQEPGERTSNAATEPSGPSLASSSREG